MATVNKTFQKFRKLQTEKNSVQFDITTVLKDAVGAKQWQEKDGLWTLISGSMTDFSAQIFQRINNYAKNIMDVQTCEALALKSIAKAVNLSQITDFIKDIYPDFLNSLINTFSIDYKLLLNPPKTKFKVENNTSLDNLEFLSVSKFLSTGAVAEFFGSIDQRNKTTFPTKTGYSIIFFLDILNNLDKLRYLLETINGLDFAQSAWSYMSQSNRLQATTLSTTYLFLYDFHENAFPSLNEIFKELQFYNQLQNDSIIQNKDKTINISEIITQDQKSINYDVINITAIKNYYNQYIGQEITYKFQKNELLSHCSKINVAKDFNIYQEYYKTFGASQTDHLQSILYYWTPYDNDVVNTPNNYILVNNYNFNGNTKIINPFLVLISIIKNIAYNNDTQSLMKMSYIEQLTNINVDLTHLILHMVQTIQNDQLSYYYSMIVFHFYGILYDNIFNGYLKKQWNITKDNNRLIVNFVGTYSQYTQEEFISLVSNYLSNDQLTQFIKNGPTYYNQYHVDFIKSISILNSIISYSADTTTTSNIQKLSYYIPYYNNDIDIYKRQSYLYDNKFYKYKQKLIGIIYQSCTCSNPTPSQINPDVCTTCNKIIYNIKNSNNYTVNIESSYIYKAALIFADYCIKIKNTRNILKTLVQQYARIGTSNLLNGVIADYFYKQFSKHQTWLLNDNISKTYDELSAFNLFLDIINDNNSENANNKFQTTLQEYYDNTNYLNIYSSSLISALEYKNIDIPITISTYTNDILITTYLSQYIVVPITTYTSTSMFDLISTVNYPLSQSSYISSITTQGLQQKEDYYFTVTSTYISSLFSSYISTWLSTHILDNISTYMSTYISAYVAGQPPEIYKTQSALVSATQTNSYTYPQIEITSTSLSSSSMSEVIPILSSVPLISTYLSTYMSSFLSTYTFDTVSAYIGKIDSTTAYVSGYYNLIPVTSYTSGYITSTIISSIQSAYIVYKPDSIYDHLNANMPFWDNLALLDSQNLTDQQILDECKFYEQYFPQLKNAYTDQNRIYVFKNYIFPFIIKIWKIHAVSGFSNQLSDLNNYYSGISGKFKIQNLENNQFPTIAPFQNIQNLFLSDDLNDYKSGALIQNYYNNLQTYSSGIYEQIFNNSDIVSKTVTTQSNYYFVKPLFGTPINGKLSQNNNYHGYTTVYQSQYKISTDLTKIQADGPWKYTFLQKFIQLFINDINTISTNISSLLTTNYDYVMTPENKEVFSNYLIYNTSSISFSDHYPQNSGLRNISYNTYNELLPIYTNFINTAYNILQLPSDITSQICKLMIYSTSIIKLQYYKITEFKQDIYNNNYILFKHYKHNKYEDAGQLWIRYNNRPLAMPFMKAIKFQNQSNSLFNINKNQIDKDLFLTDYDQVKCNHPTYTKIIKQMVNNAIYFDIFQDICLVVGYTNFIKSNNTYVQNNNKLYLKVAIFKLNNINDQLQIESASIKFITTHEDNDYLLNINEFVGAYYDEDNSNIVIILYDINKNISNINKYKAKYNYTTNLFLNNVSLAFSYIYFNTKTYLLKYLEQIYNNVKYPIIGLYTDTFCIDICAYKYVNSDTQYYITDSNMPQSVWKVDNTKNTFAIGYQSVSDAVLASDNIDLLNIYNNLYKNQYSYVDVLLIKCKLIYKNINNMFLPIINNINISIDKDYLDDFKFFDRLTSEGLYNNGNNIELNIIYNLYPTVTLNENKQLLIYALPIGMGGIKSFTKDITNDMTGLQLMSSLIHNKYTPTNINNISAIFNIQPDISTPDFKYGLKQLVYNIKNYNLLDKTNIKADITTLTIDDVLSTIYSQDKVKTKKDNIFNTDIGLNINLDLINNYNPYSYKLISDLIRFIPNISNSIVDDMKIIVNFGTLTNEIKQFLTGTQSFDLDISVYLDDIDIHGTQHFKKVGWHCGYTETDYIKWDSNDSRTGGPQILTVHLKKYYTYLYNKFRMNNMYNNPIFLEKQFIQYAKDCKLVINVCWYNQSRVVSINPNLEIIWNGIYYKRTINRQQMSFNIGCCENSFQEILHLDLVNNTFVFNEKKYYIVKTVYNAISSIVNYEVSIDYFNGNAQNIIYSQDQIKVISTDAYTQTYLSTSTLSNICRTWYIYDINKIITPDNNIILEDKDIIKYFSDCLTYIDKVSADMNIKQVYAASGTTSSILTCNIDYTVNEYYSNDINYITSSYIINNINVSGIPIDTPISTDMNIFTGHIEVYPYKMSYLKYITIYDTNNSLNTLCGSFNISPLINKNYSSGYYFDNNQQNTNIYSSGNIFANKLSLTADFTWNSLSSNIESNIFINQANSSIIISQELISASIYKIDNKCNNYYNENIELGFKFKNNIEQTLVSSTINILSNSHLNGNLIFLSDNQNSNTYTFTLTPYYKIKDKLIFLDNLAYNFNYLYYPNLLTYTDKFSTKFIGNDFDIRKSYFVGDKIVITDLISGFNYQLVQRNRELPDQTKIYYYYDDIMDKCQYLTNNTILTANININDQFSILLYKYNATINAYYTVGRLNYFIDYKKIEVTQLKDNQFIISNNNPIISFNLDISVTSSLINKYNGLNIQYNDLQFSNYYNKDNNDIINTLASNIKYIFQQRE